MPDISESLQGRDLGHLKIIADMWGLEFSAPDVKIGVQRLIPLLLDRERLKDLVESLPAEARSAIEDLLSNEGSLPWVFFTRRHGGIREMGAGKRDRERPYLAAPSPAECLWYRGLMGRGFFETENGLEEFAYIPEDIIPLLPEIDPGSLGLFGRVASPMEKAHVILASDHLVDHACTFLAARRMGVPIQELSTMWQGYPQPVILHKWLQAAGIVDEIGIPQPEQTREFLEGTRAQALASLVKTWLHSREINDLHMLPGISVEGDWHNDPLRARQSILSFLPGIVDGKLTNDDYSQGGVFWSIGALITDVRIAEPDYQRISGDYDSWYLREIESGEYVSGFENWDKVDGALIHFIITGPLHWCGIVDLAAPAENMEPTAFRFTRRAQSLLKGEPPGWEVPEDGIAIVRSDARIFIPWNVPRDIRYNIARFCKWLGEDQDGYSYQVTPFSLDQARKNGLRVGHLLSLLRRSAKSVHPAFAQALERWDERGAEVHLQKMLVLRLSSPELLQSLRKSRASRFLGDPLGPASISVQENAWSKVMAVLAEMGYLCEVEDDLED